MRIRLLVVLLVLLFPACDPVLADDCGWFRGKPLPGCQSFWLLETSWNSRLKETRTRTGKEEFMLSFELGHMRNISSRLALGGAFYVQGDDDSGSWGLRFRARYWISRYMSVELSPGVLIGGEDNYARPRYPGFIVGTALNFADFMSLTANYDAIRTGAYTYGEFTPDWDWIEHSVPAGTRTGWYIGVKFGSYAAVVMSAVLIVGVGAAYN